MVSSKLSSRLSVFESNALTSITNPKPPIPHRRSSRQPSLTVEEVAADDQSHSEETATASCNFTDSSLEFSIAATAEPLAEDDCFKAGIGDESFTSFEQQMRLAVQREKIRQRRESAKLLGLPSDGQTMSLKERLKAFQQT